MYSVGPWAPDNNNTDTCMHLLTGAGTHTHVVMILPYMCMMYSAWKTGPGKISMYDYL